MSIGNSISTEVLALMGRNRTSQTALAEALGWSQPYLSRRINGHSTWSIDDLEAIARHFDRGLASLIAAATDSTDGPQSNRGEHDGAGHSTRQPSLGIAA